MPSAEFTLRWVSRALFVVLLGVGLNGTFAAFSLLAVKAGWVSSPLTVPVAMLEARRAASDQSVATSLGTGTLMPVRHSSILMLPRTQVSWGMVAALIAGVLLFHSWVFVVLLLVRQMIHDVEDGTPFELANVARIRWIGIIVIAGHVIQRALVFGWQQFGTGLLVDHSLAEPVRPDFDVMLILVGFIIVALAEVFRRGAALEQEQSLVL